METEIKKIIRLIFLICAVFLWFISISLYRKGGLLFNQWLVLLFWLANICFLFLPDIIFFIFKKKQLSKKEKLWRILYPLSIFLFSLFLRLYKINNIPFLCGDEARDAGLIPKSFLAGEIKDIFGHGIYGIPNMFFAFMSIPHMIFGHSILATRFFAVFFGSLAVVLTYFLGKKLFNRKVGLLAAIFMSSYHVHLHFSRSEFLNLFDSFWAPLIILLLLKSQKNIFFSLLFGVSLGMASHFYQGIRAFLAFSAVYFLVDNLKFFFKDLKKFLLKIGLLGVGVFLGIGPSIIVALARSEEYFNTGTSGGLLFLKIGFWEFVRVFPGRILRSFGALVYFPIDFHYHYGGPFLKLPLSLFFVIGVLLLFSNILKRNYNLVLLWIVAVVFCNSVLLADTNFTHRLLSSIPALMITTSLGLIGFLTFIKKFPFIQKIVLFLVILLAAFFNLKAYFWDSVWANAQDANSKVAYLAGRHSASLPSGTQVYFVNNPARMSWKSISSWEYIAPNAQVEDLPEVDALEVKSEQIFKNGDLVFIVLPEKVGELEKLEQLFPQGEKKKYFFDQELLFFVYECL